MTGLKNLPVDLLKLDMSFVRGITTDAYDRAIVESIIRLGAALNLGVIAEGIESDTIIQSCSNSVVTAARAISFRDPFRCGTLRNAPRRSRRCFDPEVVEPTRSNWQTCNCELQERFDGRVHAR